TSDMDMNGENVGQRKMKFRKTECSVCYNRASKLFCIPSKDDMYKKWFSVLKWDVPPEQLKYVLNNARVCDRHFSEWCFTSTLRQKLIKFACPFTIGDDIPSTSRQTLSALPSAASQCTSVEVSDTEPCSTTELCSPTPSRDTIGHLQVTPKTRKIKTLRSSVSKLKKKLYEKRSSSRFLGQLKAKLADKPHLYNFVTSQLKMQCKDIKGRRWTAKEKSFALQIYLHSPSAYKLLRKFFAFPSKATLYRYTYNIARSPGFCKNLVKCLKSQSSRMSESDRLCVLSIDEMSIKPGLTYATDLDCVDGFSTVKKHDFKEDPPFATHALVFMAIGIVKNWKQILGYHFTSSSEVYSLQELIHEAIDILQSCELEVVSIVCDQGPNNQGLFRELKVTKDAPFFFHNSKKIFAMYDPPHLLKSVRNNLKNHGIFFEDKVASVKLRTCFADWSHIQKLYELDSKKKICACRKLTKRHIEVSGLKKMNVKLAAQVLSHSVAAALNLYVGKENFDSKASETAQFVYNMDKIFDSVNARSRKHEKKEMCAATGNSGHLELWKEKIAWIEKWHIRSSKTGRKIYAACKIGWLITLKAFIGISEYLLQKIKFIITSRFSQDALENTFSSIRRRGGFRDNPDCNEFRHTIQKVIITNFLKQSSNKNCQDDDAYSLIDFSCFNKKELLDIISSEDSATESEQHDEDSLHLNTLDSVEENVLSYISGYLAKKYLSLNDCIECEKLMVEHLLLLGRMSEVRREFKLLVGPP
ncbi:Transposable element P transposase, partial [Araneus ventricosus]